MKGCHTVSYLTLSFRRIEAILRYSGSSDRNYTGSETEIIPFANQGKPKMKANRGEHSLEPSGVTFWI
ncbi:hypothetical protein SCLCIDRAFT_1217939 [Scleroderma citrinum Foug A]|uniref:Uncharacterized protein n=1 Tax=Scleroderma citrinum Foug A TaxID=1036808 RepID=A0A0C3DTA1_9AGAM|nr:hypothetical protein SCLCIDRAFT_1217939 [Scleroderma citrinum Foug A]